MVGVILWFGFLALLGVYGFGVGFVWVGGFGLVGWLVWCFGVWVLWW